MDARGDAGPYSPTNEAFHQTINRVEDSRFSKASVGARPFENQGDVQAQGLQSDANILDTREDVGGSSLVFTDADIPQSRNYTVRSKSEREKKEEKSET